MGPADSIFASVFGPPACPGNGDINAKVFARAY
jgi:hypothetical protein